MLEGVYNKATGEGPYLVEVARVVEDPAAPHGLALGITGGPLMPGDRLAVRGPNQWHPENFWCGTVQEIHGQLYLRWDGFPDEDPLGADMDAARLPRP